MGHKSSKTKTTLHVKIIAWQRYFIIILHTHIPMKKYEINYMHNEMVTKWQVFKKIETLVWSLDLNKNCNRIITWYQFSRSFTHNVVTFLLHIVTQVLTLYFKRNIIVTHNNGIIKCAIYFVNFIRKCFFLSICRVMFLSNVIV